MKTGSLPRLSIADPGQILASLTHWQDPRLPTHCLPPQLGARNLATSHRLLCSSSAPVSDGTRTQRSPRAGVRGKAARLLLISSVKLDIRLRAEHGNFSSNQSSPPHISGMLRGDMLLSLPGASATWIVTSPSSSCSSAASSAAPGN